jgi:glycosyltransferase involved in cell wall biosynthesis
MSVNQEIVSSVIVLPSLSIRGGQWEALRIARDIRAAGRTVMLVVLWKHRDEVDVGDLPIVYLSRWEPKRLTAALQLPLLLSRLRRWLVANAKRCGPRRPTLIATHFSTLPALWLVGSYRRAAFVQDLEWHFMATRFASRLLRAYILFAYRRIDLPIAANIYLQRSLVAAGVARARMAPIWADQFFATAELATDRPVDLLVMLRHGTYKRADLYFELMRRAREHGLRTLVITPDDDLAERARSESDEVLLRPSRLAIREAYARAKIFVHMSDHEGFGLPPLEAMAAGCIPVCRNSGGVTCYMLDKRVSAHLVPHDAPFETLFTHVRDLLAVPQAIAELAREARATFDEGGIQAAAQRASFFATYDD